MDLTSNLVQAKKIPTAHCPILIPLGTLTTMQLSIFTPTESMILGMTCVGDKFLCSAGEWWNIILPFHLCIQVEKLYKRALQYLLLKVFCSSLSLKEGGLICKAKNYPADLKHSHMGPSMYWGVLNLTRHSARENSSKAFFNINTHNLSFSLGMGAGGSGGILYQMRNKEYLKIVNCDAVTVES